MRTIVWACAPILAATLLMTACTSPETQGLQSGQTAASDTANCLCPPKDSAYEDVYARALTVKDHFIPKKQIEEWEARLNTKRKNWKQGDTTSPIDAGLILPISESFNFKALCGLLAVKNSVGMRVHYGLDSLGQIHLMLTGVDSKGNTVYVRKPKTTSATDTSGGGPGQEDDEEEGGYETGQWP